MSQYSFLHRDLSLPRAKRRVYMEARNTTEGNADLSEVKEKFRCDKQSYDG